MGAGTNPFKFDDIEVLISAVEDGQKTRLREVISQARGITQLTLHLLCGFPLLSRHLEGSTKTAERRNRVKFRQKLLFWSRPPNTTAARKEERD